MKSVSQLDLFSEVMHAYANAGEITNLTNKALYQKVTKSLGISEDALKERHPVGQAQQMHNLLARKIRWHQQTLKHSKIIERVDEARGLWRLTRHAGEDLSKIESGVSLIGFSTDLGIAILGSCDTVFSSVRSPLHLVLTSPPYPLAHSRRYGNVPEHHYVDWICEMLAPVFANLVPGGNIFLNVSNDIFERGMPSRSMYRERLLLALHDRFGLHKMDELVWHNPCKPPGPVQWASKNRVQLNVGWEPIYWLTNDPTIARSDNRRVLQQHSERHLALIKQGGEKRQTVSSDGAYRILTGAYGNETLGSIPKNVLTFPHNCGDQREYKRRMRDLGFPAHGAPMPLALAEFLIKLATVPGETVADPFGGSFTTAKAAERLGRKWLSTECMAQYVIGGATRFEDYPGFNQFLVA
jgi:site-specific DNA-methyltransferase (cytosine-N4-specific)